MWQFNFHITTEDSMDVDSSVPVDDTLDMHDDDSFVRRVEDGAGAAATKSCSAGGSDTFAPHSHNDDVDPSSVDTSGNASGKIVISTDLVEKDGLVDAMPSSSLPFPQLASTSTVESYHLDPPLPSSSSLACSEPPPLSPTRSASSHSTLRSKLTRPTSHPSSPASSGAHFEASGRDFEGTKYQISGQCYRDAEGVLRANFTMSFPGTTSSDEHWSGEVDVEGSFVGYKSYNFRPSKFDYDQMFILRRIPSDIMALRPSPSEFIENKPWALWQFAIDAILYNVRKKWWSWSFFKERRNQRHRYLKLNIANWTYGRRPDGDEFAEFMRMRKAILPEHANLIRSMRDYLCDTHPNPM